jgi:ADP-glucose pyrophosphorylase
MLMNPDKEIINDPIKIMMHIDPSTSQNTYMRIKSIDTYKKANLEGQKQVIRSRKMGNQNNLFCNTKNTIPDIMCFESQINKNVKITDSNISVVDQNMDSIAIGDGSIIKTSVIGKNVKIGTNTKI